MFRANGSREPHVERSPPPSPSASVASFDVHGGYSDWPAHNRERSESLSSRDSHQQGPLMGLGFGGGSQGGNTRDGVDGWRRNGPAPVLPSMGLQEDGSKVELLSSNHGTPTPSSYSFGQNNGYAPSYPSTSSRGSYMPGGASHPDGGRYRSASAGAGSFSESSSIRSKAPTLAEKFDPTYWVLNSTQGRGGEPEADDWLHNVNGEKGEELGTGSMFTARGLMNLGCLFVLVAACFMLFAGYPIIVEFNKHTLKTQGAFGLGGINQSGQVPSTIGQFGLIDPATPEDAYTRVGLSKANKGVTYDLVFSDEFEVEGRSFYDGDDPYWTAVDLHYWATNNLEWYDPRRATTANGKLVITLDIADPDENHGLNYTGGMISTWNKFCFTGGYLETKLRLPGSPKVWGLWPAVWAMGNLGRAGYGGTLEGMWPYTYDSCDVGTLANQTLNGLPEAAATGGLEAYAHALSYLPGQRLSACTCAKELGHPGPKKADGTWTGRGAPEIDLFEAQVDQGHQTGHLSMSGQWAPYSEAYYFNNASANYYIADPDTSMLNSYNGGAFQQATSVIYETNQACYQHPNGELNGVGCYDIYGFEYQPGTDGYITWAEDEKVVWSVYQAAMGPDPVTQVGTRIIPAEPMYILANLGISENFGAVDYEGLNKIWPAVMEIDYIRVYQPTNQKDIGCDPDHHPTAKYIEEHPELYANPNITTFEQGGFKFPLNKLIDTC